MNLGLTLARTFGASGLALRRGGCGTESEAVDQSACDTDQEKAGRQTGPRRESHGCSS